jgi:hypothetical protein
MFKALQTATMIALAILGVAGLILIAIMVYAGMNGIRLIC